MRGTHGLLAVGRLEIRYPSLNDRAAVQMTVFSGRGSGILDAMTTQAKKATIVSFQREQGFGKVAIEGEGELSFDAVVAGPPPDKLLPGAQVMVEIGPSRIPGRLKVVKLWIGDTPP